LTIGNSVGARDFSPEITVLPIGTEVPCPDNDKHQFSEFLEVPVDVSAKHLANHTRTQKHTPPCELQSGAGWEVMGKPGWIYLFMASSMATATETVAPTMGLLPMPMRPIIST